MIFGFTGTVFDGKDLSQWTSTDGSEPKWKVENGFFTVVCGGDTIQTKRVFDSYQLHVEWRSLGNKSKKTAQRNCNVFDSKFLL